MKVKGSVENIKLESGGKDLNLEIGKVKQERIMDKKEVAKALGIAVVTVKKYLEEGRFPNARKVPVREGSKLLKWDIPESDLASFEAPPSPGPKPKPEDELSKRRHISVSPDVDDWLSKRQEADSSFNLSAFINGLIREVMSREAY